MSVSLSEAIDGFVATINNNSDVRCFADPSSFAPPCVLVDVPESIDLQVVYTKGLREYVIPLLFIVPNSNPRTVRDQIQEMIDTVDDVLVAHDDLDGIVESVAPINVVQWQIEDIQEVSCLTCVMRVSVLG